MLGLFQGRKKKNNTKQTQGMENLLGAESEQGWPGGAWLISIHTSPGGSQSLEISGPNFSISRSHSLILHTRGGVQALVWQHQQGCSLLCQGLERAGK